ncbi:MAG: hypothetical protein R6V10_00200 [bacterium]
MKKMVLAALVLVGTVTFGFTGCDTGEEGDVKSENRPPQLMKVKIFPASATPGEELEALVEVRDYELDEVEYEYKWFANDEVQDESGKTLSTAGMEAGTKIYLKVLAREKDSDRESGWKKSNTVVLGEAPPPDLGGVSISPQDLITTTDLSAEVDYGDVDPADVYRVYYRWFVNDEVVKEGPEETELSSDHFRRGDRVYVEASLDEQFPRESTVNSKVYPVVNAGPVLETTQMEKHPDRIIVRTPARDKDGDRLNFKVNKAPKGTSASMQGNTLVIEVPMPEEKGGYDISFAVSDGHGGSQTRTVSFSVR